MIVTPCYVGYADMTVVLPFNRFVQLLSAELHRLLFSRNVVWMRRKSEGKKTQIWCGFDCVFVPLFMAALASSKTFIVYVPYSWDYDDDMSLASPY